MKKLILTAVSVGVVGFGAQSAHAGDREWAAVGKVLTGVAAGVVIAKAMDSSPSYTSVSYGYVAPGYSVSYAASSTPPCPPTPPVVYAPAPAVAREPVYHAPPAVCRAAHSHPGRGNAYGHYQKGGSGRH